MKTISVKTNQHTEFKDITGVIQKVVSSNKIDSGVCTVFIPHTTAGVTINENADPDVITDLKYLLENIAPWKDNKYKHFEGNTAAHLKASFMGSSVSILIENGQLQLGRWQSIFFTEFDGPRNREAWIKILEKNRKDNDI